jgi:hypothetical protein
VLRHFKNENKIKILKMQVHAERCEFVLHNVSLFCAEDQPPRGEGDKRVDEGVSSDIDEDPTPGHNCSLTLVNCSGVFLFLFPRN